jgi:hypothetical protein
MAIKRSKSVSGKNTSETKTQPLNTLSQALRHFETAEANLVKLERLWKEMEELIPEGIAFITEPAYEEKSHLYKTILPHLSKIDGWSPSSEPMELNNIAQSRFDAEEIHEVSAFVAVDEEIYAPRTELEKYRILLNRKRRELTRSSMEELIAAVDEDISILSKNLHKYKGQALLKGVLKKTWSSLVDHVAQIATILGSSAAPSRWYDLRRHMSFAEQHDLKDIITKDWPVVKRHIQESLQDENDPIPSDISDLSVLVATKPRGSVPKELNWNNIGDSDFERLIFMLVSNADGYENPQWLMDTNAPDKGRDISVDRIVKDALGGTLRFRVIIQCKHWQRKSVAVTEIQTLQAQMKLWEPPRVDVHIIATTGRFTVDAVTLIEKENQSDKALRVEMWPESHIEKLLAARPDLIAHFNLR